MRYLERLVKTLFIGFNILMTIWVVGYWIQVAHMINGENSEAAAIGIIIGTIILFLLWALGDVILGMFVFFSRSGKVK